MKLLAQSKSKCFRLAKGTVGLVRNDVLFLENAEKSGLLPLGYLPVETNTEHRRERSSGFSLVGYGSTGASLSEAEVEKE